MSNISKIKIGDSTYSLSTTSSVTFTYSSSTPTVWNATATGVTLADGLHITGKAPVAAKLSKISINNGTAHYVIDHTGAALDSTIARSTVVMLVYNGSISYGGVSGVWQIDSNYYTKPTVGNGTITIKQGSTTKGTFTTNQSSNTTIILDEATSGGGGDTNGFYKYNGVISESPVVEEIYYDMYNDSNTIYPSKDADGNTYGRVNGQMIVDNNGVMYYVFEDDSCVCAYVPQINAISTDDINTICSQVILNSEDVNL